MLCPDPLDPTSFYRGAGPFGHMKRTRGDIELLFDEQPKWPIYQSSHVAFFQRPSNMAHVHYIKQIKEWGLPLWIDYDDDLLAITPDNPVYPIYANNEVRQAILAILPLADVVTVSTETIKARYDHLNSNIRVVPNAFDERLIAYRDPLPDRLPNNPTVLWRGSHTHQKDLATFSSEILRVAEANPKARWYFQGYNPYFITDLMPEHTRLCNGNIPIEAYFRLIHNSIRPAISMVPLWSSPFNHAKSNIAVLESAFAGAASLVPNWSGWKLPGTMLYSNPYEFATLLADAIHRPDEMKQRAQETWDYVSKNLLLKHVNEMRFEILDSLVK